MTEEHGQEESMNIDEQIDRLLQDAEHAESGALIAATMFHKESAVRLSNRSKQLRQQAERLYIENPDSKWPDFEDCTWPAPERKPFAGGQIDAP